MWLSRSRVVYRCGEGSEYASLVGGLGDWVGRVLIGLGALLLAAVVGIGAIALAVLFVNAVT
jgi:hypothetical protein